VASAVAYSNEKRLHEARDPDAKFGRGDMRGLVAPEAANNAAATGSFIPMLTLGVPGSGTTAVMMGALTLYNITPGPVLFETKPELVWGLIASLAVANVILLLMNVPMVRVFASMLAIPGYILVPGILAISFIGVYAISGSVFDLLMMTAIGVVGYFMVKVKMPMAPLVLGVVLGDLMEQNFRRGLSITNGDPVIFVSSTICITLWILALAVVVVPPALRAYGKRRNPPPAV
jgi:putative tricarboxylic transport membrane protein